MRTRVRFVKKINFNLISKFLFLVFTFFLLFSPPIFGIHSKYFITVFAWIYLMLNNNYFFKYVHLPRLNKTYIIVLFFGLWSFFLVAFNDGTRAVVIHYIYWIFTIIPASICIGIHALKVGKKLDYILNIIILSSFIQSLISIIAVVNFDIKMKLLERLQADETIIMTSYTNEIYYRLYGYAAGLTFDMPVLQSMIMAIALFLCVTKNYKYVFFIPTIAFSAFINARTSIVVIFVSILTLIFLEKEFFIKRFLSFIVIVGSLLLAFVFGSSYLEGTLSLTYGWVIAGIEQLIGLLNNDTGQGYFSYLFDENRWSTPDGINFLFGVGERVMGGSSYGVYSDIGYVNDIWFGGLLYLIVLYSLVIYFFISIISSAEKLEDSKFISYVSITYFILLPILNFKTYIVSMGGFSTLLTIILSYSFLLKHKRSEGKII